MSSVLPIQSPNLSSSNKTTSNVSSKRRRRGRKHDHRYLYQALDLRPAMKWKPNNHHGTVKRQSHRIQNKNKNGQRKLNNNNCNNPNTNSSNNSNNHNSNDIQICDNKISVNGYNDNNNNNDIPPLINSFGCQNNDISNNSNNNNNNNMDDIEIQLMGIAIGTHNHFWNCKVYEV
eukprot:38585_1